MPERLKLASIFLEYVPESGVADLLATLPGGMEQLEDLLHQAWDTGRAPWSDVSLPAETFVRHLATQWNRPMEQAPLQQKFEWLAPGDFYLACACVEGIPAAIAVFEHRYLARLPVVLGQLRQPPTVLEDICQKVRIKLLVRTPEAPPKIAEYSGLANLYVWVGVVARYTAYDVLRTFRKPGWDGEGGDVAEALEGRPASEGDPEHALIKEQSRGQFLEAVSDAIAALSKEDRLLLRLLVVDRLPTTRMAPLFRKSQSTISRQLQAVRQQIYENTKLLLQERLHLGSQEFESFLRIMDSEWDISIHRILAEEESTPADASDTEESAHTGEDSDATAHSAPKRRKIVA